MRFMMAESVNRRIAQTERAARSVQRVIRGEAGRHGRYRPPLPPTPLVERAGSGTP
jgi:hypothetical protein